MPRFAVVVVVNGRDADQAIDFVRDSLAPGGRSYPGRSVAVFIGGAAEVPEADEYSAERIEMYADDEPVEVMPE